MVSARELVELYGLQPHPEGGYYRETYRSAGKLAQSALPAHYSGDRAFSTAIYYMLTEGSRSRFHRLGSDEFWHFYLGGPIVLAMLSAKGPARLVTLGQDVRAGQAVQQLIPAGTWFGAWLPPGVPYALVGCTVAPGFDFADFEVGGRAELLKLFPAAKAEIERLTE